MRFLSSHEFNNSLQEFWIFFESMKYGSSNDFVRLLHGVSSYLTGCGCFLAQRFVVLRDTPWASASGRRPVRRMLFVFEQLMQNHDGFTRPPEP